MELEVLHSEAESPEGDNSGLAYLNFEDTLPRERTLVVIGPPRSGTSMDARALAWLGIPMGVPVPAPARLVNYEDPEFVSLLHVPSRDHVDRERLRCLINYRNRMYRVWGFKVPMAAMSLELLAENLRNPFFVFVYRDLFAAALRNLVAMNAPLLATLQLSIDLYSEMLHFLQQAPGPCMLVSYEKALQRPTLLCSGLAIVAGADVSYDMLSAAVAQIQANHREYLQRVVDARRELGLSGRDRTESLDPR